MRWLIFLILFTVAGWAQDNIVRISVNTVGGSGYSARLVGIPATRTSGDTISGAYNSTYNSFDFLVTNTGRYKLQYDAAGGSSYTDNTDWDGSLTGRLVYASSDIEKAIVLRETADTDADGKVETAGLETDAVTSTKILNSTILNADLADSIVGLANLTTAAYNFISSGGSVTNNPDGTSIENKAGSTIGIASTYFTCIDTSALKAATADSSGMFRFLRGLTSTSTKGNGMFVQIDSVWDEGVVAFDNGTAGKQWVRMNWHLNRTISDREAGVIHNDNSEGANNTARLQAAIDRAATGSAGRLLITGPVYLNLASGKSYCLDPKTGYTLEGTSFQPSAGARLILSNSQNGTVLYAETQETAASWTTITIKNLGIDCNGANNTTANGINIYRMGEPARIQDIHIRGIRGYGIYSGPSTAHDHIENVAFFFASAASKVREDKERIGLWTEGGGQRTLISISGDEGNPTWYAHNSPTAMIDGLKVEGNYSTFNDSTCIVWADSCDGNTSSIGITNVKIDVTSLNSIFRVTGTASTGPSIIVGMGQYNGYDSLIVADNGTQEVPSMGVKPGFISVGGNTQHQIRFYGPISIDYNDAFNFIGSAGTNAGYLKASTDGNLYVRSHSTGVIVENTSGTDVASFHATNGSIFNTGIKVGAASKIDTLQYKASGDSLQIFINGTGWKAFKLNSSSGN